MKCIYCQGQLEPKKITTVLRYYKCLECKRMQCVFSKDYISYAKTINTTLPNHINASTKG